MKNQQTPEKRQTVVGNGHHKLDIHSIFHTIQGEGPFCGTPAVFIRLAGCNLQCPKCDTDYTSVRRWVSIDKIIDEVARASYKTKTNLIVITGGEPFRQDIGKLVSELYGIGYYIQVETNGTLPPPLINIVSKDFNVRDGLYIVVSPKAGKVNKRTEMYACAYKYVMGEDSVHEEDGLPFHVLGHSLGKLTVARPPEFFDGPIYLQPIDEDDAAKNQRHLNACIRSCMKFNYILQLQIHKLIGVA